MFGFVKSFRPGLLVATLFASLFIAAPSASAATITATSGDVTATYSYSGTTPPFRNLRLIIRKSGRVVDRVAVSAAECSNQCGPDYAAPGQSILRVVRLRSHGSLDVVLDLFSGGAHCCTIEQVYAFDASTGHFHKSEYNFGNPGVRVVPYGPGGSDVFLSADDHFAFAFTDYAASGMPIEILSFSRGGFHNVTRSFPILIAQDAQQWQRAFAASAGSHYQDSVGLAAAWAADEDMLGHFALVRTFLQREARAGHLNSALSPIEPSGQKFVAALHKFLRHGGYEK